MAFSALRSFYARAGYSAAPRLPVTRPGYRRPEAGACHRQIIPATGASGYSRPHPVRAGSDKWTAPVWPALFAASSASRAAFSASFCFFTFHFGGVVTLMMVFRLRTGAVPSVFRFSVSTGRFCSVMLCSASDESSSCGQRYHTRHSARTPSTAR